MKKFFQSKGFIVSSLALLCVSILGVCWFVSRDRTGDFRPDESPPSSVTGDWLIPLRGVDMGAPLWAMHSACETASTDDHVYCIRAFRQFFSE